jgi:crotonobetainyl-CoA:carnitine CoA-transferase CaiB-like acyl-CoA transferase
VGGPLEGIRVIDLTAMVSGPLATCVLADRGADVIKVEPPGAGDLIRQFGSSRGGLSAISTTSNRNERSIALDLASTRGRELLGEAHPTAGPARTPRPVARFERTAASLRRPAPLLGEDGVEVCRELRIAAAEIAQLREQGVLA